MPFFDFKNLKSIKTFEDDIFAVIPKIDNKIQMSAVFYHKTLAEFFVSELAAEQKNILTAIKKVPHNFAELQIDSTNFFSINTKADLRLAQGRVENFSRKVPVISIIESADSEKSSIFIEKLINIFAAKNLQAGVIKSNSREFDLQVERNEFQNCGAKSVAVVSPEGWFMIQKTSAQENFLNIAEKMDDVDLIFIESKIPETQPAISLGYNFLDEKVSAIFTDAPKSSEEILQLDINDTKSAVEVCKFLAGF